MTIGLGLAGGRLGLGLSAAPGGAKTPWYRAGGAPDYARTGEYFAAGYWQAFYFPLNGITSVLAHGHVLGNQLIEAGRGI